LGGSILQRLGEVIPYLFEENFIIALEKKWVNQCKTPLKFSIILDNKGRLSLIGPKITGDSHE